MWQVVLRCDRRVHLLLIFSFALYLCSRSALFVILCSYMCILHFGAAAWSSLFKSCAKDMLTCQHTRKHLTTCSLIMFRQTGIFAYRRQQFGSGVQLLFQRWLTFRPIKNLALGKQEFLDNWAAVTEVFLRCQKHIKPIKNKVILCNADKQPVIGNFKMSQ